MLSLYYIIYSPSHVYIIRAMIIGSVGDRARAAVYLCARDKVQSRYRVREWSEV